MQIILKQRDIEAAVKAYVVAQGISLANKRVEINFTAGRKETGISVEIDIEDASYYQNVPTQRLQNPFIQSPVTTVAAFDAPKQDIYKDDQNSDVEDNIEEQQDFEEKAEANSSSLFA